MKNNAVDTISFFLILLWIYASVSKLADYDLFVDQLSRQPLPLWSTHILALLLPAVEIIIAMLLIGKRYRRAGLMISFLLLCVFTMYVGLALGGAYDNIPCSCGGIFSFMGWKGHLILNAFAATLALSGWQLNRKQNTLTISDKRKYFTRKREASRKPVTE